MNKIKFSHEYFKMPSEEQAPNTNLSAHLLEVLIADRKELSDDFVKYDTAFLEKRKDNEYHKGYYDLPDGKLLVLILITYNSSGPHLWTTIRRWTPEKEKYYRALRGEEVSIVIEEGK